MSHEIILDSEATLNETPGCVIVCDFAATSPSAPSLGLMLLNEDLVEDVVLRSAATNWVLRIRKAARAREVRCRWYAPNRLESVLGQIELERWLVFFLKYYRDGMAEVDHIDVEGVWNSGRAGDFVFKVAKSHPPLSEEEARRRLGLA